VSRKWKNWYQNEVDEDRLVTLSRSYIISKIRIVRLKVLENGGKAT